MPSHLTTGFLALCAALAALSPAMNAEAAPGDKPTVSITSLTHSEVVWSGHPGYNPADETLIVSGTVDGITKPQDFMVRVQGLTVPVNEINGVFSFFCELPFGPTPPNYPINTQWPLGWPDRESYENPYKVYVPVMAQLRDTTVHKMVARHRIIVRDIRFYDAASFHVSSPIQAIDDGLAAQITPQGVAQLEPVHEDSLPFPGMDALDDALQIHVDNIPVDSRQFTNGDGLCVDLYDGHPLTQTNAYAAAEVEAWAYLTIAGACAANGLTTVTETAAATLLTGPIGAIAGMTVQTLIGIQCSKLCVKAPPIASKFKACVQTVTGELTDVDVVDIKKATVELTSSSGKLESVVKGGEVQGTVRVELSDVWIRWHKDKCSFRPKAKLDVWDLADTAAWRTCEDLSIEAKNERTANNLGDPYPIVFNVDAGTCAAGALEECVDVSMAAAAPFLLHDDRTTVDSVGTCGESWIFLTVHDIVEGFYDAMEMVVDNGWYFGGSDMYQGQALDALFQPLNVGTVGVDDYTIDAPIDLLESGLDVGIYMDYDAEVPPGPLGPLSGLQPEPYSPPPVSTDGVALSGQDFSISYTITTAFLNQVLTALHGTWRLNKDLSLKQLALASVGMAPLFSKSTVKKIKYLIKKKIRIRMYPTLTPIAYMPPDAPELVPGGYPLYYEGAQLMIELYKYVGKNKNKKLILARVSVDFWDFGFSLLPPAAPANTSGFMSAGFGDDKWTFTLLSSKLPGCQVGSSCETQLLTTLRIWLLPFLRPMMAGLLSQIPAPLHFDAEGHAPSRDFELIDVWSDYQQITYYGDLLN